MLNEPSRWPSVAIVRKIARLFEVPAAELRAFFRLCEGAHHRLCLPCTNRAGEVSHYAV
ncbi:hypothetical protein [Sphingomonas sp. Root241]|uniref:hypothetical protein n=1 Tax=Sphingomonas sp. Root241 TaxID=1736501 RepID=UPI000AB85EBF|nr:hypothetical protein [Sphingomonas sp. Root241]